MISGVCRICGSLFLGGRGAKVTCRSPACLKASKRRRAAAIRGKRVRQCAECAVVVVKGRRFCDVCLARHYEIRKRKATPNPYAPRACQRCSKVYRPWSQGVSKFCKPCGIERARLEKASGGNHRRRARKFGVAYEPIDPIAVFDRDGWVCQLCSKPTLREARGTKHPDAPEVDHRIPMSKGGPHLWANVQTAHRSCNFEKRDHIIERKAA